MKTKEFTIEGTPEYIFGTLKRKYGTTLSDQELSLLFSLEMKANPDYTSDNDDINSFWLYEDPMPATLLIGKTRYSVTIYATCSDIIKKIIKYAGTHVKINDTTGIGLEYTPEQNNFIKIQFIYEILSSIYKNLYKLEDYEWCFCFSAVSYLRNNNSKSFSAENVLNVLDKNTNAYSNCLHIGEKDNCTWKAGDECRLNKGTVGDVISHLCENNVIKETYPKSGFYEFVM